MSGAKWIKYSAFELRPSWMTESLTLFNIFMITWSFNHYSVRFNRFITAVWDSKLCLQNFTRQRYGGLFGIIWNIYNVIRFLRSNAILIIFNVIRIKYIFFVRLSFKLVFIDWLPEPLICETNYGHETIWQWHFGIGFFIWPLRIIRSEFYRA